VFDIGPILEVLCEELGLRFLSDHPIWYADPATDEQKVFYGDLVVARPTEVERITAADLLIVIEVVSSTYPRKEVKDTSFQRALNEYNEVPEFGLLFPEPDETRTLHWCRLHPGEVPYRELRATPGSSVTSSGVEGLEFRVLPRDQWAPGRKIEVWYRGVQRLSLAKEHQRAEAESQRAETESQRAETERQRAEAERQRAEAERQRAETEHQRAEAASQRAETEHQRAEAERQRADELARELAELRALLARRGADSSDE
jgi:hypothetical protein